MKHVEVDYHFVRDRVLKKLLDVRFISTSDQLANGFTKAISQGRSLEFQHNFNLNQVVIEGGGVIEYLIYNKSHHSVCNKVSHQDVSNRVTEPT
jgi:hypothetical protein